MKIRSAKDMVVDEKAYALLAMETSEISQSFPGEEGYALSGKSRRSSQSVAKSGDIASALSDFCPSVV